MAMKDFNFDYPEVCCSNEVNSIRNVAIVEKIEDRTEVVPSNEDLVDKQEKPKQLMDSEDDIIIKKRPKKHHRHKESKNKHTNQNNEIKLLNKRVKKLEDSFNGFVAQLPEIQNPQTKSSAENAKCLNDDAKNYYEELVKTFEQKYGPEALLKLNVSMTDDKNDVTNEINEAVKARQLLIHKQEVDFLNEKMQNDMHKTSLLMHQLNLSIIKRSETSLALNYSTDQKHLVFPKKYNFRAQPRQTIPKGRVAVFVKLSEVDL